MDGELVAAPSPPVVYLSARYFRKREMLTYATLLRAAGLQVAAHWLDRDEPANPAPEQLATWAIEDMEDVLRCDWFITSTECRKHVVGDPGYGGRMVELGVVLASRWIGVEKFSLTMPRITVVGPHEGLFTHLPEIEQYPDWPSFVDWLTKECAPW